MEVCLEVQSTRNNTADIADVFIGKLEKALKVNLPQTEILKTQENRCKCENDAWSAPP